MGHMIAFGILTIIAGFTQTIGRDGGRDADYGNGLFAAGIVALAWAVLVLIVRSIP